MTPRPSPFRSCSRCGATFVTSVHNRKRCNRCKPARRTPTDPRYNLARWRRTVRTVMYRDNRTCRYCRKPAQVTDHVRPVTRGGDFWSLSNLVACCYSCNASKRDLLYDEWRAIQRQHKAPTTAAGYPTVATGAYGSRPRP